MAVKIFCDICEEEINPEQEFATMVFRKKKYSIQGLVSGKSKGQNGEFFEERVQICEKCAKKIEKTIQKIKKESSKKVDD